MRPRTAVESTCSLEWNRTEREPISVLSGGLACGGVPGRSTKPARPVCKSVCQCGRLDSPGLRERTDGKAGLVQSLLPPPDTCSSTTNSDGTARSRGMAKPSHVQSAPEVSTLPCRQDQRPRRRRHDGRRATAYQPIYCLSAARRRWRLGMLHRLLPFARRRQNRTGREAPKRSRADRCSIHSPSPVSQPRRQSNGARGRRATGCRHQAAEHGEHLTPEALRCEANALHGPISSLRADTRGAGHDRPSVAVGRC